MSVGPNNYLGANLVNEIHFAALDVTGSGHVDSHVTSIASNVFASLSTLS